MKKTKFFIKRKNTYLHETVIERGILFGIKHALLVLGTLGWTWIMICLLGAIVNA